MLSYFQLSLGNRVATYWENTAHSAYVMFSWYKYLIVNSVFSHLGFWSGNLFLIAQFPDRCLLVPFSAYVTKVDIAVKYVKVITWS